jgi:lipopolysaccharide biosynthesis regulator YciM
MNAVKNLLRKISGKKALVLPMAFLVLLALGWAGVSAYMKKQWQLGTDSYRQSNYSEAADRLKNLPMPKDQDRLSVYAQVMHASGNTEKAKAAYERLAEDHENISASVQIGNIALQQKDDVTAIAAYEKVINQNPGYVQAYVNLASVYRMQGHIDLAVSTLKKGIQNNPNASSLYAMMVGTLAQQPDSQDYKDAATALKKLDPQNPALTNQ